MTNPEPMSEFERGKEAGRVAQMLGEHSEHLAKINGSIDDSASALVDLAKEMRQLRAEAQLREERVVIAAETLAAETERRRIELADTLAVGDRRFTRRERLMALALACIATFGPLVTLLASGKL